MWFSTNCFVRFIFVLKRFREIYGEQNVPGYFAYYDDTCHELGKFEWLKSLEVINEERFNEIKKSIDKKEVKD